MLKDSTLSELFRLDTIEGIGHRIEGGVPFYLFRPYDLLPEGQELAINVHGMLQLSRQNVLIAETYLEEREVPLFLALVISYPCHVESYQMLALHTMQNSIVVKGELERARQEQRQNEAMQPVDDLIAACNHKIIHLGITVDQASGYLLKTVQSEPERH